MFIEEKNICFISPKRSYYFPTPHTGNCFWWFFTAFLLLYFFMVSKLFLLKYQIPFMSPLFLYIIVPILINVGGIGTYRFLFLILL